MTTGEFRASHNGYLLRVLRDPSFWWWQICVGEQAWFEACQDQQKIVLSDGWGRGDAADAMISARQGLSGVLGNAVIPALDWLDGGDIPKIYGEPGRLKQGQFTAWVNGLTLRVSGTGTGWDWAVVDAAGQAFKHANPVGGDVSLSMSLAREELGLPDPGAIAWNDQASLHGS